MCIYNLSSPRRWCARLSLFLLTYIIYRVNYRIKRFVMAALQVLRRKGSLIKVVCFSSIYRNPDVKDPAFNIFYSGLHFSSSHACLVLSMLRLRRVKGSCVLKWLAIMPNIKNNRKFQKSKNRDMIIQNFKYCCRPKIKQGQKGRPRSYKDNNTNNNNNNNALQILNLHIVQCRRHKLHSVFDINVFCF